LTTRFGQSARDAPVPPSTTRFGVAWTGIGGYTSQDLIQVGTSEDALQGYYAWYEILPASETLLTYCSGDSACTANTGTNYFGPTSAFTDASGTHTIAQGNPVSIDMGARILVKRSDAIGARAESHPALRVGHLSVGCSALSTPATQSRAAEGTGGRGTTDPLAGLNARMSPHDFA
jgi:hypothetical protein